MRKFMLLNIVLGCLFISIEAKAQCISTQDCAALGYTSSSCSGKGVKCPFGNAWYCPCDGSYNYTCTGTNESPGLAKCGNKYNSCNCSGGTYWDNGRCKTHPVACNKIGLIYYADGTCHPPAAHDTDKTALGIIVYMKSNGTGGQVMTAKSLGKYVWSTEDFDIDGIANYDTQLSATKDMDSCGNTNKIIAQGNSSIYPAAWAAKNYAPTLGTKGMWCLPASGVMNSVYNNLDAIQTAVAALNGTSIPSCCTWSSTERDSYTVWVLGLTLNYGMNFKVKPYDGFDVRPVFEF